MIELLLMQIEKNCENFDLQFKKGQYRLILNADNDFTGQNLEEVLKKAIYFLRDLDSSCGE